MNVNELKEQVREVNELRAALCGAETSTVATTGTNPYPVGRSVFVRTATYHFTGRLIEVHPNELVLEDAACVFDSGRFSEALAKGTLNEVEPYPDGRVVVGRNAVIDVCEWKHELPRVAK